MLLMGKSTISMAIFNSFLYVYQRVFSILIGHFHFSNSSASSAHPAFPTAWLKLLAAWWQTWPFPTRKTPSAISTFDHQTTSYSTFMGRSQQWTLHLSMYLKLFNLEATDGFFSVKKKTPFRSLRYGFFRWPPVCRWFTIWLFNIAMENHHF